MINEENENGALGHKIITNNTNATKNVFGMFKNNSGYSARRKALKLSSNNKKNDDTSVNTVNSILNSFLSNRQSRSHFIFNKIDIVKLITYLPISKKIMFVLLLSL